MPVLPVIRLAPVAPYGKCLALSGNGQNLAHAHSLCEGVWVYLHQSMFGAGSELLAKADEVVLHELLHNELEQFGESLKHEGSAWARRCQELSNRLDLNVRIERKRSLRRNGKITSGCRDGFLPYDQLARWPAELLRVGPPLRARLTGKGDLYSTAADYNAESARAYHAS